MSDAQRPSKRPRTTESRKRKRAPVQSSVLAKTGMYKTVSSKQALGATQLGKQQEPLRKVKFLPYARKHPKELSQCPEEYRCTLNMCEEACGLIQDCVNKERPLTISDLSSVLDKVKVMCTEDKVRAEAEEKELARARAKETLGVGSGTKYQTLVKRLAAKLKEEEAIASRQRALRLFQICDFLNRKNLGGDDKKMRRGLCEALKWVLSMRGEFFKLDLKEYLQEKQEEEEDEEQELVVDDILFYDEEDEDELGGYERKKNEDDEASFVKRKLAFAKKICRDLCRRDGDKQFKRLEKVLAKHYTNEFNTRAARSKDAEEDNGVDVRNIRSGRRTNKADMSRLLQTGIGAFCQDDDSEDSDYVYQEEDSEYATSDEDDDDEYM